MRLLFIAIMLLFPPFAAFAGCDLPAPVVLRQAKNGLTLAWELQDSPALHRAYEGAEIRAYRNWVQSHTSFTSRELLENSLKVGQGLKKNLSASDRFRSVLERDEQNALLILSGRIGRTHPLTCLESLPFLRLARLVDLKRRPVEFFATILWRADRVLLIADFYPHAYSGAEESPTAAALRHRRKKQGWRLGASFHNHPFHFANSYGDIGGTLAPSSADIKMYQNGRPGAAWITNGIETIVFSPREYDRLQP